MADSILIYLRPLVWTQELRSYPDDLSILRAVSVPHPNCDLILSDGTELKKHEISTGILSGELTAQRCLEFKLDSKAIGGLWFTGGKVHGWFYFGSKTFGAVWDQVRTGDYVDCTICLEAGPVQDDAWKSGVLSITSASVDFRRRPYELEERGPHQREERNRRQGFLARLWR